MLQRIKNISGTAYIYLAIIILEFFLFKSYVLKNIASFYPVNIDQNSYLLLSYKTYENIKQFGLISGFKKTFLLATGMLFPFQAVLCYFIFGVSRLSALLPNFIYFILLQLFTLIAVKSVTHKNSIALLALGLILTLQTPFLNAGGLMDFRMDFIAFCLYGIILATTVKSEFFLKTKWTVITALFSALLILLRCITIAYLLPLFGLMFCYFLIRKNKFKTPLINLFFINFFICIIGLIYLWINKQALFNYYMIGHMLGTEKNIRAIEMGVTNFFSLITFYPLSLLLYHVGILTITLSACVLFPLSHSASPLKACGDKFLTWERGRGEGVQNGTLFFSRIVPRLKPSSPTLLPQKSTVGEGSKTGYYFFLTALFVPLIILTLDTNKSPVVGNIMVMPVIWLIIWSLLFTEIRSSVLSVFATSIILAGLFNQIHTLSHHKSKYQTRELLTITKMYQDIGDYAVQHQWPEIYLSVDQICDYLTSAGIANIYYELRSKYLLIGIERMGASIFPINKAEAIASMQKSNVVILNLNNYSGNSPYPFNQSIKKIRPDIKHYAENHFEQLGDYAFFNSTYRVYVAKTMAM